MKKKGLTIDEVRVKLEELMGQNIHMQVCRGRKQIKNYEGVIESALPRVFVVRLSEAIGAVKTLSYSYSDVLCGEVTIVPA